MSKKDFESCPLNVVPDEAVQVSVKATAELEAHLKHQDPAVPEKAIEEILLQRDAAIFGDRLKVKKAMAAACIGVRANGQCCLVGLTPEENKQRFNT